MPDGRFIVVDVGKTLAKVSLWSADGGLIDRQTRPNARPTLDGIARLDAEGIAAWLPEALACYAGHPVEAIVPVGHGAGVVALAGTVPAYPPLDYEQALPPEMEASYRAQRGAFAETGSPPLPAGLNCGAQLHWLETLHPGDSATLIPWAQYWAWFLCGVAASEVSSLGCHSDLWNPTRKDFSALARRGGWAVRFAPLARAGDVLGNLKPELAQRTGLPVTAKVLTGLHDSNAAVLAARGFPEMECKEATVLSTGTWFVAMRLSVMPVAAVALPEDRDCLLNVDVRGHAVPSARFMGGREIETLIELDTRQIDMRPDQPTLLAAVPAVVTAGAMVLPTFAPGTGPFPTRDGGWRNRPDDWFARRAAVCLYAALVTDRALDLIGSSGKLLVEGRFADAQVFVRALASLRPDTQVFVANAHHDVSFGALRLIDPGLRPAGELQRIAPLETNLAPYKTAWLAAIEQADRAMGEAT